MLSIKALFSRDFEVAGPRRYNGHWRLDPSKSDPQMREYVGSLWIGFCLGLSLGVLHKAYINQACSWSIYVEADGEGRSQAAKQKRFRSLDLS